MNNLINLKHKIIKVHIIFSVIAVTYGLQLDITGDIWNRYTLIKNDNSPKSYFSLERGLFSLQPRFSDKINGNVSADYYSEWYYDYIRIGFKIKTAFIEFHQLLPSFENKLLFGYDKLDFGLLHDWDYATIEKTIVEKEQLFPYEDFGLRFSGNFEKYVDFTISLTNGAYINYYNYRSDLSPAITGGLHFSPTKNITLGGSIYANEYKYCNIWDGDTYEYHHLIKGCFLKINSSIADLTIEYITKSYQRILPQSFAFNSDSRGIMITPVFKINSFLDIVMRYDWWDPEIKADSNNVSTLIAGINYNIMRDNNNIPNLFLQVNWQRVLYQNDLQPSGDQYLIQLRWRFNSHILN